MFRFLTDLLATDPTSARTAGHAPKARLGVEMVETRCTPGGGNWDGGDTDPTAYNPIQISQVGNVAVGSDVSLNPQPLPPGGYLQPTDPCLCGYLGGIVVIPPNPI